MKKLAIAFVLAASVATSFAQTAPRPVPAATSQMYEMVKVRGEKVLEYTPTDRQFLSCQIWDMFKTGTTLKPYEVCFRRGVLQSVTVAPKWFLDKYYAK